MRRDEELSDAQVVLWTTFGVGTGLLAGFALSEWMGGVTGPRMQRAARRLGQAAPVRQTPAASARAVDAALHAEPRLAKFVIEVVAVSRGTVELRGWVTDRAARTLAARVATAVTGIDTVINSILVRGEDDRIIPDGKRVTDQSA
ncbi:MAG TPA: BON domain-containing protein [Gemmatimonadales bacterium]|nr:BON domain-containing protein [Gemmatimonadales bacterium]